MLDESVVLLPHYIDMLLMPLAIADDGIILQHDYGLANCEHALLVLPQLLEAEEVEALKEEDVLQVFEFDQSPSQILSTLSHQRLGVDVLAYGHQVPEESAVCEVGDAI